MKKIVLACAAGMSTSMLVVNMRKAAEEAGYACEINAYPISDVKDKGADADIVLLGPQVRFQLAKIKGMVSCPVEAIDATAYGTMNGKAVIAHVREVLGD